MPGDRFEETATAETLRRKARRMRIEANHASAKLAAQLIALAARYEAQAQRVQPERR